MIRCFDSDDIQNVNPTVDPIRDLEIIETEMMLADLESIQKRLEKSNKKNVDEEQLKILEVALDCINNDKDISILKSQFEDKQLNQSGLLSIKPKIFVCNVDEQSVQEGNQYTKKFIEKFGEENTLIVSADIENQINELDSTERKNYMEMIGLKETGLSMLIQKGI
jgi:ribosome-binding ATPase YchF (GTP1/OBG family)